MALVNSSVVPNMPSGIANLDGNITYIIHDHTASGNFSTDISNVIPSIGNCTIHNVTYSEITFGQRLLRGIDSIPIAGHIKGAVHYSRSEYVKARRAEVLATRSWGIFTGAAYGSPYGCFLPLILGLIGGLITECGTWIVFPGLDASALNGTTNATFDLGYIDEIGHMRGASWVGFGQLVLQLLTDVGLALMGCCCATLVFWFWSTVFRILRSMWRAVTCCCRNEPYQDIGFGARARGYGGLGNNDDNRANQLNRNNWRFWRARGMERPANYEDAY